MKVDHCLVALHDDMFRMKLGALRKYLGQLGECSLDERLLAEVVPGEWVGAHHRPVDVLGNVFEEGRAVTALQFLKDFANTVGCNGQHLSPFFRSLSRAVNGARWRRALLA